MEASDGRSLVESNGAAQHVRGTYSERTAVAALSSEQRQEIKDNLGTQKRTREELRKEMEMTRIVLWKSYAPVEMIRERTG